MELKKITITNFRRLLRNVEIDVGKETLIVGKNNTGKTSVSELFSKFLTQNKPFRLMDFSSSAISSEVINSIYENYLCATNKGISLSSEELGIIENSFPMILMELLIETKAEDNLALIKPLLFEFEKNENIIIRLKYEFKGINKCVEDYNLYNEKILTEKQKDNREMEQITFFDFFKRNFSEYYVINSYSSKPGYLEEYAVDLIDIQKLFNIGIIAAQREVDDTSDQSLHSISNAIWNYYKSITKDTNELKHEDIFKSSISNIKESLNNEYNSLFNELINSISENIMLHETNQKIEISSDFNIEDLLKKNSKLKYMIDDLVMPESYNGLGFSNMVYMFIQIITYKFKIEEQKRLFNVLFIEEPESHLHPQMQSTFLNKIADIMGSDLIVYRIITTHSSYILQSTDLASIRYFYVNDKNIDVRSLDSFFQKPEYSSLEVFIRKYFKINTCDLFFADKAILVEGTVERMLMPLLIQKYDSEFSSSLVKQHITIIEVGGAYAHAFNGLLRFLQIKTLIITDIDSVSGSHNETCKCDLSNEGNDIKNFKIKTSNAVIKDWYNFSGQKLYIKTLLDLYNKEEYLIKKDTLGREVKRIAFQLPTDERLSWGRTFEEQFIIENAEVLQISLSSGDTKNLQALINAIKKTKEDKINETDLKDVSINLLKDYAYEIVENIDKTNFALDLLIFDNWVIPQYIKEGLKWLEKQ